MADKRDQPSGRPTNADTETPVPDLRRRPGDPPLREDYGGPRQAADGQRVTPDATDTKAPTTPRPSGGEVKSGATRENFGAPTHSATGAEGQE